MFEPGPQSGPIAIPPPSAPQALSPPRAKRTTTLLHNLRRSRALFLNLRRSRHHHPLNPLNPLSLLNPRARGAMSLILDIHGDPWYHISNFKEGNDKKSRASRMAKRAACGESSAGGPPEDGLGASGPNGQARRDCPLQQQGIYGIVRRTCQVLFR